MTSLNAVAISSVALTAPGEKWEVNAALRDLLCFTSDGTLHIVDGYAGDHFVMGFVERLRRAAIRHTQEYVTPEQLKSLYNGVPKSAPVERAHQWVSHESASRTQDKVVAILKDATKAGASDVHFFATPNGHQLRYRIHGVLENVQSFAGSDGQRLMSTIYESMSESTDTNYRPDDKQDGRLKSDYVSEAGLFGARIATRPCLNGPWMAMRLLYDSGKLLTLDDMGYLPEQIEAFLRLIHRTDGMVLLTGTTGSGKSTTIQTCLKMLIEAMLNTINVVTVEDPVEYRIPGAQQTPLKEAWADAIANLMRLDPDVLMVGEMRDFASALAAFQAALTGHGLWSTLHVNSAAASLQRLGDLGVDPNLYQDPSLVKGLINQSLTRRLCPQCKVPFLRHQGNVASDLRSRIMNTCIPEQVFLQGEGCEKCGHRGIIGRSAIAEIIQPDLDFMRVFKEQGKAEAQRFWIKEQGGITKNNHLIRRINEGIIDPSHGERDICALDDDLAIVGGKR